MIIAIRTDKPEAELGLYASDGTQISYTTWLAHRQLAETLHRTILKQLREQNADWQSIVGIIFYKGPGSFTGLRIGAAVANAWAAVNQVQLVSTNGNQWIERGLEDIRKGSSGLALPEYGAEARTTLQKK